MLAVYIKIVFVMNVALMLEAEKTINEKKAKSVFKKHHVRCKYSENISA